MSSSLPQLCKPGYSLPIYQIPNTRTFPLAVSSTAEPTPYTPLTVRERNMMAMIDMITDKESWRRKVFDDSIVQRWRAEAMAIGCHDFMDKMFHFCIAELRDKAGEYEEEDMVAVYDSDSAVIKSDSIVPLELMQDLQDAVRVLEDVPEKHKDWHPGSNGQVLDLVHPSLFPLVYGHSRVLPKGILSLEDCLGSCGNGKTIRLDPNDASDKYFSDKFQWLPAEVRFSEDDSVKFTSYINNLHPVRHKELYAVIERITAKAVTLWSTTLGELHEPSQNPNPRIPPLPTDYEYPNWSKEGHFGWDESCSDYMKDRKLIMPEPRAYKPREKPRKPFNLRTEFATTGLQVIVKLATIHLTPEQPSYGGGSWHIEGMLNEHICATALYYYSSDNITDSFLDFRKKIDTWSLVELADQNNYEGVEFLYNVEQDGAGIQDLGSVRTRQGRLLAFPNVLQHHVSPFRLADPTRPGYRKILALFLVDPYQRVVSTENVPPQQKEWWAEVLREDGVLAGLPVELFDQIVDHVEDWPMSLEKAKGYRLELMKERTQFVEDVDNELHYDIFCFCEH